MAELDIGEAEKSLLGLGTEQAPLNTMPMMPWHDTVVTNHSMREGGKEALSSWSDTHTV